MPASEMRALTVNQGAALPRAAAGAPWPTSSRQTPLIQKFLGTGTTTDRATE